MREDKVRFALFGLLIVFFAILFAFRKRIAYPFCTLESYTGRVNRGKSSYFLLFHLFISSGLGITCYVLLNDLNTLSKLFEDTVIRLSAIALLWLIWILIIGWLIELYLQATDKAYKDWKVAYLNQ